jgi:adenylate cyclase class 2
MPIETEIKFRVDDLADLNQRLEAAGFTLQTPRAFESNVLYDTPDRSMRARTEILRIRSYAGRFTITHKRMPDVGPGEDTHKHRIETETEVADGDAMAQVFLSLGLVPAFRYEKWRAEWTDRAAARLGIPPSAYSTLSYGRLFEQWRERHHSTAQDLTFAAVEADC